jgi:hypothetical protein
VTTAAVGSLCVSLPSSPDAIFVLLILRGQTRFAFCGAGGGRSATPGVQAASYRRRTDGERGEAVDVILY